MPLTTPQPAPTPPPAPSKPAPSLSFPGLSTVTASVVGGGTTQVRATPTSTGLVLPYITSLPNGGVGAVTIVPPSSANNNTTKVSVTPITPVLL